MQLDFSGPYVLTAINIVLFLESSLAFISYPELSEVIPNLSSYCVIKSM